MVQSAILVEYLPFLLEGEDRVSWNWQVSPSQCVLEPFCRRDTAIRVPVSSPHSPPGTFPITLHWKGQKKKKNGGGLSLAMFGDLSEKWPSFAQHLGCHSWGPVEEWCAF